MTMSNLEISFSYCKPFKIQYLGLGEYSMH